MKKFPDFCDLACAYAELPKDSGVDGAGSCRTFVALYCGLKKSLVHKNAPCRNKKAKDQAGTARKRQRHDKG